MSERQPRLLIGNARVYTPTDVWAPGWVLAEEGHIRALGPGGPPRLDGPVTRQVDADGRALLPGFIDLHVHGAMGHEVMDGAPDGIREMARFYARHGVTGFLPTTWTASREEIAAALAAVGEVSGSVPGGATVLGAYLEGPYLNPAKCGAQDSRHIRRVEAAEALSFLDTGLIRVVALAPEYEENLWLIGECVRRGITVSAAHTEASYEEMKVAVARGLRQATHTFNAMAGLHHRHPGTAGAVLSMPQINAELIADMVHVHPAVMEVLVAAKGTEHIILVTDAIRGAGMPEGEYAIDERLVSVRDGAVRLPDGTLAGSILTLEVALRNVRLATARPLAELWPMASLNPARAIGIAHRKGSLEVNKDADLVLLNGDGSVSLTVVAGAIVFEA